ncbi:MAG: IS200/IS605 family accessory protein TnpB-related protein [Chroococcidiopsidaceae cyanobacterium CP_BM_ER_R8_30]|nr:IS200/IS605 family accessory protein TnpB-related protein [Chroococcidiopsidaceae cyanobacterium CP_BM_ER_R8_30]
MINSIIRTDRWVLSPTPKQAEYLEQTERLYRSYARALIGVVYTHFPQIVSADSPCAAVEKLIHKTAKNPNPRYQYFSRRFYKFPSYLRRAVIQAAIGQVSSFVTRYISWQTGRRKRKDAYGPRLNAVTHLHTVLYRGQCIFFEEDSVQIKVFSGKEWAWERIPVVKRRERHLLPNTKSLSPHLVINRKGVFLAIPFEVTSPKLGKPEKVCGVDLGLNTIAVASIVSPDGTVTARKFFNNCAADIDRRDKRLQAIRHRARLTMGKGGKLYKGFCKSVYRKAQNINRQICQMISKELVSWVQSQGATVIVFENLKNWRPKGGRKGSTLRQRFHGWLKSQLVQLVADKFVELGGQVEFVSPRGTSSYAYDVSGQVKRDKKNYSLATFRSGKKYSADLNASYNIAARFWIKQKPTRRNRSGSVSDRSFRTEPRMPDLLCSLWS